MSYVNDDLKVRCPKCMSDDLLFGTDSCIRGSYEYYDCNDCGTDFRVDYIRKIEEVHIGQSYE